MIVSMILVQMASLVIIMCPTISGVLIWQTLLAAVLMVLIAIIVVRAVARMFRAQMLLFG